MIIRYATCLDTSIGELEDCFKSFVNRDDIAIVLINQHVAEMIRHILDSYTQAVPAVLEIPSKEHPYEASKDSILRRAKVRALLVAKHYTNIALRMLIAYITFPLF